MNAETPIRNRILHAVGALPNVRAFHSPNGYGYVGRPCPACRKSLFPIRFGLHDGSSDIIGIRSVLIGPEHLGMTIGQLISCEVKTPTGTVKPEQQIWLDQITRMGGKAFVARSVEEALAQL